MACDSPYYVMPKAGTEKVPVPCGKCPACKLRRVNGWVFRMLQEAERSEHADFVTFTYDTRTVPISDNGFMTLRKRDFQLFMKRLRKLAFGYELKYYAVGEYGSNNNRPHYHAIIFNCPDPAFYNDAWGLGQIHIGTVSGDSIAYTMKYLDKQSGKKLHVRDDREPEFPLMSKRLGDNYLTDEIVRYHQADLSRLYLTRQGGQKIALPRYYREKVYSDSDLKKQKVIIVASIAEQDRNDRYEHSISESGLSYEAWMESRKYGRYRTFYSSQKNRDL